MLKTKIVKVMKMQPKIVRAQTPREYLSSERCYIAENHSDPTVSIARAQLNQASPQSTSLNKSIQEIYIITAGKESIC